MIRPVLRCPDGVKFFDYWASLPKSDFVPDRRDFDPVQIPQTMPWVTMLDVHSAERVMFRLFGTGLVDLTGVDLTGENYPDYVGEDHREALGRTLVVQSERPCGRVNILKGQTAQGRSYTIEAVTLPLSLKSHDRTLLLGFAGIVDVSGEGEPGFAVASVEDPVWIDVGAGVPDF